MRRVAIVALALVLMFGETRSRSRALDGPDTDPLSFLGPTVQIDSDERERLNSGETIAKILPAHDHELAVLFAGSTTATADMLVNKVREIVALKKSSFVPEIGRFSKRPRLQDVAALTLDQVDLDSLKTCRPGHCDLKLTTPEIERLHSVMSAHAANATDAVQEEFRRIVVERVTAYRHSGQRGIPPYGNGDTTDLAATFSELLRDSPYVQAHAPQLARYLAEYPARRSIGAETFLYWSKETLTSKPIISVTHVAIARGRPHAGGSEALVLSKEVFATHYTSGALALTLLTGGNSSSTHYLVYVNRTWVDPLHWFWRPFVDHRVKSDGTKAFAQARERIEGLSKD